MNSAVEKLLIMMSGSWSVAANCFRKSPMLRSGATIL